MRSGIHADHDRVRRITQQHRRGHEAGLEGIDRHHRLEVAEPEVEQAMVHMVARGLEPVHLAADAQVQHHADVRDGQAQQQQRQRRAGGAVRILDQVDDQEADGEAQHLAAGIAHEHPRRMRVVAQEAEDAAGHHQREMDHQRRTGEIAEEGDGHQAQQCFTGSQAIESIGVVDGIDHAHQRHHGEGAARPFAQHCAVGERQARDIQVAPEHHQAHCQQLPGELGPVADRRASSQAAEGEQHQDAGHEGLPQVVLRVRSSNSGSRQPAKMPQLPIRGTGTLCTLRGSGWSTMPICGASRQASGITSMLAAMEVTSRKKAVIAGGRLAASAEDVVAKRRQHLL